MGKNSFKSKRHMRRLIAKEKLLRYKNVSTNPSDENIVNRHSVETSMQNTSSSFISCVVETQVESNGVANNISTLKSFCKNQEECVVKTEDFITNLKKWCVKYQTILTNNALNELLSLLRTQGYGELPKDIRTFIKTPKAEIVSLAGGEYCHLGVEKNLKLIPEKYILNENISTLNVCVNIDGLPLFKSSSSQFWPILMSLDSSNPLIGKPFMVGLYHGLCKPTTPDFLNHFIHEFSKLESDGVTLGERKLFLKLTKLICDAPAKSFVLCVKGHTGYNGCTKCIQEGEFVNSRMTFPELNSRLRTDNSVREKNDEGYHKTDCDSPFSSLNMGLVSNVPLDYMHLVCLGVVKRMLSFWIKGKKILRMTDTNMELANSELMDIKKYIPTEFARLPRSLHDVDRFKATEFRQLLLYTGPVIFRKRLTVDIYRHFLALHCAIRILCCKVLLQKYLNYARDLLKYFVENFSLLYGPEYLNHNVHNLIHLADDCKLHGPLDQFSAFKYENFLYKLKKSVKFSRFPLQQAVNKYQKDVTLEPHNAINFPFVKSEMTNPTEVSVDGTFTAYKNLHCSNLEISINCKNICIVTYDSNFFDIKFICKMCPNQEIVLFGHQYLETTAFYNEPCDSKEIFNFVNATNKSEKLIKISLESVAYKCIRYPLCDQTTLIIPLLHNENV